MSYSEYNDSHQPALEFLQAMGWVYVKPEETVVQRGGVLSNVLLEDVLEEQLIALNEFEYKGEARKFSDGNIHAAIYSLKNIADTGLVNSSEKVYDLITLGKSFEENIQGDRKSFTIKYIDWEHPENNVYHVTDEFEVTGLHYTRRPDIVLFVNGIPFVVIESKRRDKQNSVNEAISQHIRNQGKEEGIPKLYHYAQLLLAMQPNEVKYATVDTKPKFWSVWEEESTIENSVAALIGDTTQPRIPTVQDRTLYCLTRPERLIELVYKFLLYDGNEKKICRYQQYFAVQNALNRVKDIAADGKRKGGVIWHTQGSGKSLTMVMLAKSLALDEDVLNPRVIIVTDRIDLDNQIAKTFESCQKHPVQARSGNHLIDLVEDNSVDVITTIIDKFDTALSRKDFKNESNNIFVLVDESHRSQYGNMHARMKKVLPKACYIGFTGTPLMKRDKSTANKFGGFIHTYTIEKAVKDKSVVPLLYEGRSAKLSVNNKMIDKGFERLSEPLTEYQSKDLKKKFASLTEIYKSEQVIEEIAYDISQHYCKNWKGKGFKAMLAVPLKSTAIAYLQYFESQIDPHLKINAKVIISSPDTRKEHEEPDEEPNDDVLKWYKKINQFSGGIEKYEEHTLAKFKHSDEEVELLIVVGKLLTGFDAPNCTVLYIAKPLAEHNLLQAIARVNRLYEGKDFGYIVDYVGLLGELDEALTSYAVLSEFDEDDLKGSLVNISEEIKKLPQRHGELLDIFKEVSNKNDKEEYERLLAPKNKRDLFIEKLIAFGKNLQTAMSSDELGSIYSDDRVYNFLYDFRFFDSIRRSVEIRYAEKVDYKEYEKRVRKLLDTYIGAEGVEQITGVVNIFDEEVFKKEVERLTGSTASKADAIAHQVKKIITVKIDEDPVLYTKFSQLIDQVIADFNARRISELSYLNAVLKIRNDFVHGSNNSLPDTLKGRPEARAFYGIISDTLKSLINEQFNSDSIAQAGCDIDGLLNVLVIRDWQRNEDVIKKMKNDIEDYILELAKTFELKISFDEIDIILERIIGVAKKVY